MTNKSIWFDMDGVLVKHVAEDYEGRNPKWLQKGYFQTLKKDDRMARLISNILNDDKLFENIHLSILSKVHKDPIYFLDQVTSKKIWLKTHGLKHERLNQTFTSISKPKKAMAILGRSLTAHDILIDDYNPNLKEWTEAGGTAIKYGKGNPESWEGHSFQDDRLLDTELMQMLYILLN